ncbi:MAG: amidohydrolase family protein [Planctomycetaceae bacterium]|nr:amidohydrolase family protein [Planctomycetaceae bacterium]
MLNFRNLVTAAVAVLPAVVSPPTVTADVIAYTGATIETVGKAGTIENGIIVIRDGKITAVGEGVDIPASAKVVDISGTTVLPALVNIYNPITVGSSSSAPATRTITIGGRTFTIPSTRTTTSTAFTKLSDNVDPASLKNYLNAQARLGVGFVNLVTRGYGQSITARVEPDDAAGSIVSEDGHLFLAVTNSTSSLDVLRKGLKGSSRSSSGQSSAASAMAAAIAARTGGTPPATSGSTPSASTSSSSPTTALWTSVREGKTPVIVNANNAATIMYLLKIQQEFDKACFVLISSGQNIYRTIDELKNANISVLLKAGIDTAPRSNKRINVARELAAAKIPFGFSPSLDSSLSSMPDTPLLPVAMLVKSGLSREDALRALTLAPAKMLGLEKTLGSIEVGKQANLIMLDGDPLTSASSVQQLVVEGVTVYEN